MTLEAAKEMDRRCVLNWLNEVYVTPSRAFDEYTEDELRMFAYDALVLLIEQKTITRCKNCKWYDEKISMCDNCGLPREQAFFCADGTARKVDEKK